MFFNGDGSTLLFTGHYAAVGRQKPNVTWFCFPALTPLLSPGRSEIEEEMDRAGQIKAIVSAFPRPLLIVMRYLFAFLNQ